MPEQIEHEVATYMAQVAKALESVPACKTSYGEFYVSEAIVAFDGDNTSYRIIANEHGGYSLSIGADDTQPAPPPAPPATTTGQAGDQAP